MIELLAFRCVASILPLCGVSIAPHELEFAASRAGEPIASVFWAGAVLEDVANNQAKPDESSVTGRYRLSGDEVVKPAAISDDGRKTYISWLVDQAMPAVFAIGPTGEEEMVEGHMRDGVFTIDRVYRELVFRIDREKASAKRIEVRQRR